MSNLKEIYERIEYLRNKGVKMKEIAEWVGMAPSVVSSLYTTVLPNFFNNLKTQPPEEALDQALVLVNNISKKRLINSLEDIINRLNELEPSPPSNPQDNLFACKLNEEMVQSANRADHIHGIYRSYSISSSNDSLKNEPFIIKVSENKEYLQIARISVYGETQWGFGIMGDPQNLYCLFNENPTPQFSLVTFYLQIPLYRYPKQLRGLYLGLDHNRNPITRRLVLIKEEMDVTIDNFREMKGILIKKEDMTDEQKAYYDYTCQKGDFIKMSTIPSLQMDESDLIKEKILLSL